MQQSFYLKSSSPISFSMVPLKCISLPCYKQKNRGKNNGPHSTTIRCSWDRDEIEKQTVKVMAWLTQFFCCLKQGNVFLMDTWPRICYRKYFMFLCLHLSVYLVIFWFNRSEDWQISLHEVICEKMYSKLFSWLKCARIENHGLIRKNLNELVKIFIAQFWIKSKPSRSHQIK